METKRSVIDFNEIIKEIEENKIVLPDFQRNFVWSDKKAQTKLVASVMCKMPLGSVLMLTSKAKEFASKRIGTNDGYIELPDDTVVEFLLDGQQRITVLTNVFSSIIHKENCKISSLKRRYFLQIPKRGHIAYERNYFGLNNFNFPLANPKKDIPEFMTDEIERLIEVKEFKVNEDVFYNPRMDIPSERIISGCLGDKDSYLIPLYLLTRENGKESKNRRILVRLVKQIVESACEYWTDAYTKCKQKEEKIELIKKLGVNEESIQELAEDKEAWEEEVKDRAENWKQDFMGYLEGCIENMDMHIMEAPNSNRAKAIEVFENLNKGGVSLSTFDLVMARVAKVNKTFVKDLIQQLYTEGNYYFEAVPDKVRSVCEKYIKEEGEYSASIDLEYCNEKGDLHKAYKDVFLNVLSLTANNPEMKSDKKYNNCLGREDILNLTAEQIDQNFKKVCKGLDRAAFFLKTRCGIRSIAEVNYKLMLCVLGFLFTKDEWYQSTKKQNFLEAWYWCSIFSGHYDKDQNTIILQDLEQILENFHGHPTLDWIYSLKEKNLKMQDFSDKDFLLYENYESTRNAPKKILGNYICQFYLARTYPDMFDEKKKISAFIKKEDKLEKHHIIPLGSVKKIKESTSKLRKQESIYNSPLNFIYITDTANKEISSKSVQDYENEISNTAAVELDFDGYGKVEKTKEGVREILASRYKKLDAKLNGRVENLLEGWKS